MRRLSCFLILLLLCSAAVLAKDVTVTYLGHSCFTIQEAGGPIIMIDPFDSSFAYPGFPCPADIVLVSHAHADHMAVWRLAGDPVVVHTPSEDGRIVEGDKEVADGFTVCFVEGSHATATQPNNGLTGMFSFEVGGIRFAHLGDLGTILTHDQVAKLGDVDVLLLPVGGTYTLDADDAAEVVTLVAPKIAIPMHYYASNCTPSTYVMNSAGAFRRATEATYPVSMVGAAEIVLSSKSLPSETEVWIMTYAR